MTSMKVTRYIIRVVSKQGKIYWVSQGTGLVNDFTKSYIYTKKSLAERKMKTFSDKWYSEINILPVVVDFVFTAPDWEYKVEDKRVDTSYDHNEGPQ